MASQDDVSQMASLLLGLTQPNTETIRHAEATLKPILKDPRCVPALFEIIKGRGNHADSVRHVATILLRKRIASHYGKFDKGQQVQLKSELLQVLASETERPVRGGVVGIVAVLAKQESEGWEGLWQFVAAAAGDTNAEARELAFWLLQETTETIGLHLQDQFTNMRDTLFAKGLQDPETVVQKATVKALGQLMSFLANEPDIQIFLGQLQLVLQVAVGRLQQENDEDTIATVLDVLYDLSYSPSVGPGQLKDMVQFALLCIQNSNIDITIRDSAALVIATLAEAKPKTFGKEDALVVTVLETLFTLIENSPESAAGALLESNPAWKEEEEDGDDDINDSPTETSMAQGTLDMLACELPKKYIFGPCMTRCMARLSNTQSASSRKAGIAGLGVIAEGCSEPLREHLTDLIPHVLAAAGDADAQVRECACFALGQISEHCQPEILGYSNQILPIVFSLLDDATMSVQATSCYVLEMFCERLEPEAVRPLLDPLVRKLAAMLEATTKRAVQEMAVAALAATAVAAEAEFTPYIGGIATLMNKFMGLQEEHLYSLRGRALECMGHMAIAVGKQTFRPYFTGTMQCACEGLATESTDLHEFAYAVFANLSKVMGEEFAPVLPELVPHLVKVIGANEGHMEKAEDTENSQFGSLDDSDDEDDENGAGYVLHVRTALLEAKKGAITAIGEMGLHSGSAFVPYLEQVMEVLCEAGRTHWHPIIKCEVAEALPSMITPSIIAYHNGEVNWQKGDANPDNNPLSQHTSGITAAVLTELVELMQEEEKETVGKACEGIQSVIELVGPHALSDKAPEILKCTHDLLIRKAPCQEIDDAFEQVAGGLGEDDDDNDHEVMMTAVCDLVAGFTRVMGIHFIQYLPDFLTAILAYAKSSRPVSDRSMAMGCVSELAQEMDVSSFWESQYKPAILQGLADPDDNVRRNAAFGCGVCCEKLGDKVVQDYPTLLQALSPLFSIKATNTESTAACRDNGVAAVSRMIMASTQNVPLAQVLAPLLQALPLQTDMTENETVYTCLLGLLQMNQPDLLSQSVELKRVFLEATADNSRVANEIKEKLKLASESMGWVA
eukprot:CAMPEP_0194130202 /NCGR_PEP_ID=MMETSP0152-20130528/1294_1 /TAXON_ID=1049557 /ORGANISM="Thalassiothrix antarctica, Strain L6-D1" /LENGTH=1074 /DNA_ID=CAMNT_0038824635 /DNA_START=111 /DNA_END=3335 /DNA_ORIENTATION=+